ncbi:MAG: potassium transporter [Deltaproteobacteria bacterium]|nr:potassium transporter [Deltaproteobacteria bacterium]
MIPKEDSSIFQKIAHDQRFQNFITWTIVTAGLIIGMETFPSMVTRFGSIFHLFDIVILGIFILEIVIKIGAEGTKPWRYFMDPWNIFDFLIVAVCFLPIDASFAAVLRLARLFRVLKLVRALPKLQVLVSALLKSLPSMAYVGLLLGLLFYIYSVAGVFLFGQNDPVHFGNLWIAMLSLFRVVTGEDWTDVMYIQMYGCKDYPFSGDFAQYCTDPVSYPIFGALFFVSFMFLGSLIILNLFIGVIMSGMEEAQQENELARREYNKQNNNVTLSDNLGSVLAQLAKLQTDIETLKLQAERQDEQLK